MERPDEIDPYLAAYRASEPRRRRSPFGDPRLAQIAEERAAQAATPWYRRLLLRHPAPAFASSALALALLLVPVTKPVVMPMAERAGAPASAGDMLSSAMDAPPLIGSDSTAMSGPSAPELLPTLLAMTAVAGVLEGVRRLRATRG
jgi:hypothetical protein